MAVASDDNISFKDYAHPERLVSTEWLARQLNDGVVGSSDLVVLESDEDVLLYETGHIPGAVKVDWHLDLNDPVKRDYVDGRRFAQILGERGIGRDTTVVIYGDKSNWGCLRPLGLHALRTPGRAVARRRPGEVGRAGAGDDPRRAGQDDCGVPGGRAQRRPDPGVQG